MSGKTPKNDFYARIPAKVLGCLKTGEITAIVSPGHGIHDAWPIPMNWIPVDLRMPNSEFDILMGFPGAKWIRILRKDEGCAEIEGQND